MGKTCDFPVMWDINGISEKMLQEGLMIVLVEVICES